MRNETYSDSANMVELSRPLHDPFADAGVMIREANHRIANSLAGVASMVRMQASEVRRRAQAMTPDQVRELLNEVSVRLDAIGRLHRLVSQAKNHGRVDLGFHLAEVSLIVAAAYEGLSVIDRTKPLCDVDSAKAGTVTLIVSELITNAAKHAHPTGVPGIVTVACSRQIDGSVMVEVCDDGVGLPEDFNPATDGGLGFQVMRALAANIGATLTFETGPLGMCSMLVLPSEA